MPIGFLTDAERDRLRKFPQEISLNDITAFFTLSDSDLAEIQRHKGDHNRFGFALQLCTLRYLGFCPDDFLDLPVLVSSYLAQQLEIPVEFLKDYGNRAQTRTDHFREAQEYLKFRDATQDDFAKISEWLLDRALEHDRPSLLFQMACEKCYDEKIIRPGITIIERFVATARKRAQLVVYRRLFSLLTNEIKSWLDLMLLADDNTGRTLLSWMRKKPEENKSRAILTAVEKLDTLKLWGVNRWDLSMLNPNLIKLLYQIGKNSTVYELQRLPEVRRYPILITFLKQSFEEITDETVELYERCLADGDAKAKRELNEFRKRVAQSTNEKLEILEDIALLILDSSIRDEQLRIKIHEYVPPEKLQVVAEECKNMIRKLDNEHIDFFGSRYHYFRQFIPAFLKALDFRSNLENDSLLAAIELLRQLDTRHQHNIPDNAPLDCIPTKWLPYVVDTEEKISRRYYELCVLWKLRDSLRAGNIWINGSRRFANPESYLIPREQWRNMKREKCELMHLPENGRERLNQLQVQLENLLEKLEQDLSHNQSLRIEDGKLVISPLQAEQIPESAEKIKELITERLPRVELASLLIEVDNWTHFTRHFEHPNNAEPRSSEIYTSLYAAILAQACNFGLTTMAEIANLSYYRLAWCSKWYIREETLKAAFTDIVNFQYHQNLSRHWGGGTLSSSDGQRFPAAHKNRKATALPRYFGYGRGITFYTWTSDQFSQYGTKVIPSTIRDATYVLDGILDNATELPILEHTTDTAGYTHIIFALFDLLGLQFSPRLRDIGEQCLYKIDSTKKYHRLDAIVRENANCELILQHWDELLRIAASIKMGWVTASLLISKLQAYPRQNILTRVLQEYGRIIKTIFILRYSGSEDERRRIGIQLNKGEALHDLRKFLCFANRGKIWRKQEEEVLNQANCLNLVTNAVIAWNTVYMAAAIEQLKSEGIQVEDSDIVHLSPCRFEHINPYGKYHFDMEEEIAGGKLRPLRKV